jgi:uncharacterized membrane protein YoaK (UPF0700 family)
MNAAARRRRRRNLASARKPPARVLRVLLLLMVLLILCQAALGMAVNLFVTIPGHHPGSQPSNYLTGSADSIGWALGHGDVVLAAHVALGLALVVVAIALAVVVARTRRRGVAVWSVLGGLLTIGAAFNGASFLDFNTDVSSLIMALLAFGAIASYVAALYAA